MADLDRSVLATIHHRRDGSGALSGVFFNGASLPLQFWDPVVEGLRDDLTMLRFDQRSVGASRFEGHYTLADTAADADAVLTAEHIDRAVVIGHAWGGRVAQVFARDYPHRIRALVIIGTGGQIAPTLPVEDAKALREFARVGDRNGWEAALERCYCAPGFRQRQADAFRAMADLLWHKRPNPAAAWDSRVCPSESYWGKARVPTLLLYGAEDRNGTPANAADLAGRLPQARLVTIEQAGHFVVREQPDRIVREIAAFIDSLERSDHE